MPAFRSEPPFAHDTAAATGVLLINLGTPDAPTAAAVRRYLRQFLWDRRVVEIPRALWWAILHGVILPIRSPRSAAKYAKIWTPEGSPLRFHTERQVRLLVERLGRDQRSGPIVDFAMRYGHPSIPDALEKLRAAGCRRILLVPLYPQYAASTTGSALDELARAMLSWRNIPELRYVRGFHDSPGYIAALAARVREHWDAHGRSPMLVMSFHGVPRFTLTKGDPYHCECQKTARLLAETLELSSAEHRVTFQSRFGRAEWLQPYTQATVEQFARDGTPRVDVICPGFVSDCLETLEEVALECKAAFLASGGKQFHYIPCLNEQDEWIEALRTVVAEHLGTWLTGAPPAPEELARRRERALALGATQ